VVTAAATAADAAWAALAALAVAMLVLSHLPGARLARLRDLVRWGREAPVPSIALLLGWAWLGWHFFAR
jgi:hypothetical protein